MYQGACLCGEIHYQVTDELGPLSFCHCHKCQKATGSAFLAGAVVNPAEFTLDDPNNNLKSYQSSKDVLRFFCGNCGSPLYSLRPNVTPVVMRLRVGTLDTSLNTKPSVHIFYDDKVAWCDFNDEAPKHHQGIESPLV